LDYITGNQQRFTGREWDGQYPSHSPNSLRRPESRADLNGPRRTGSYSRQGGRGAVESGPGEEGDTSETEDPGWRAQHKKPRLRGGMNIDDNDRESDQDDPESDEDDFLSQEFEEILELLRDEECMWDILPVLMRERDNTNLSLEQVVTMAINTTYDRMVSDIACLLMLWQIHFWV